MCSSDLGKKDGSSFPLAAQPLAVNMGLGKVELAIAVDRSSAGVLILAHHRYLEESFRAPPTGRFAH